jgi:hypothetical protein
MKATSLKYQRMLIFIGVICAFLSLRFFINEYKYHDQLPLDFIFIVIILLSILIMVIVFFASYFDKVTRSILALPSGIKLPFIVIAVALGLAQFAQIAIVVKGFNKSGFYWPMLYIGFCAIAAFICNVHLLSLLTGSEKKMIQANGG